MTRAGVVKGSAILNEKVVWRLVVRYGKETELGKLAPHDLRRTCAKLPQGRWRSGADPAAAGACVRADDRAVPGTEPALVQAVNDGLGLDLV